MSKRAALDPEVTIEFGPGCPISVAAEQLVAAAQDFGFAQGSFNGIELTARRDTTAQQIVDCFNTECAARAEAYRTSPAGIAAERERQERIAALQFTHDRLLDALPRLNFADDAAVLAWLCELQTATDHIGVIAQRAAIVATFERSGFQAGVNCEAAFKPNDRDNVYRWLVGQALDGLKTGRGIHPIIHKFSAEWKAQFVAGAQS